MQYIGSSASSVGKIGKVHYRGFFSARTDNLNDHYLRNYDTDLSIPQPKKEFLKRSFRYRGAAQSIYSFKNLIKSI